MMMIWEPQANLSKRRKKYICATGVPLIITAHQNDKKLDIYLIFDILLGVGPYVGERPEACGIHWLPFDFLREVLGSINPQGLKCWKGNEQEPGNVSFYQNVNIATSNYYKESRWLLYSCVIVVKWPRKTCEIDTFVVQVILDLAR